MTATPTLPPLPEMKAQSVESSGWTVPRERVSRPITPRPRPNTIARVTRRFECEWLAGDEVASAMTVAPALPAFEAAFNAFTHGALIQTCEGPVAVEDLVPGMMLDCGDGQATRLLWKGSITLVPGAPTLGDEPKLYRIMADAFGLGRPVQDQTFGPGARRLDRDPKLRAAMGTGAALVPLNAVADGHAVIEVTPMSPMRVYHLACETHSTIFAAGLEVESFHPGPETLISLPEEMQAMFMQFFPHMSHIRDFGRLATPRITAEDFHEMFA